MVRIAANGDILPDAAPSPNRAQQSDNRRPQQGFVQHAQDGGGAGGGFGGAFGGGGGGGDGQGGQSVSVFDSLNQKLLEAGIPRWNAGPYVVEPIVSVGFVLAGVLIGWHGLLFAGLLFFVAKYSASQGHNPFAGQRQARRGRGGRPSAGGGGGASGGGGGGHSHGGGGGGGGHRLGK